MVGGGRDVDVGFLIGRRLHRSFPSTTTPLLSLVEEYESITILMDTSPTALFESYEQDFRQFVETIQEKLQDNGGGDKGYQNP